MTANFERKETLMSGATTATIFGLYSGTGTNYIGLSFNSDRTTQSLMDAWRGGWAYKMLAQEIPPDMAHSLLRRLSLRKDADDIDLLYSHILEIPSIEATVRKTEAGEWRKEEGDD